MCGVMTAAGADPEAGLKYVKIFGEKEKAVESVKFDFLGMYRPGVILGNSNTPGVLGYVMPLLHWAMPSKYHSVHKNDIARAMVAQSEQAFLAMAQGNAPKSTTVKILEYKDMEPFFIKGERDEPSTAANRLRWIEVLRCLVTRDVSHHCRDCTKMIRAEDVFQGIVYLADVAGAGATPL